VLASEAISANQRVAKLQKRARELKHSIGERKEAVAVQAARADHLSKNAQADQDKAPRAFAAAEELTIARARLSDANRKAAEIEQELADGRIAAIAARERAAGAQAEAERAREGVDFRGPTRAAAATERRQGPLGAFPAVLAISAVGVAICSVTDALSRATLAPTVWLLWAGIAVIVGSIVYRLCAAEASTGERVALVCLLGLELYLVKLMRDPFGYTMPDEFFHAYNAQQIVLHHQLFSHNSLLPITSRYPGLEGATSALMTMTGMSSFGAGLIVIGAARLTMMLGLFVLFSALSGSPRVAGLGAAAYAGNSNFLLWGAQFSYESLALPLLVLVLASVAERGGQTRTARLPWAVPIVVGTAAVIVTHHLTSYLLDLTLVLIAGIALVRRWQTGWYGVWPFALTALVLTAGWLVVVASETVGYIYPVVSHAFIQTLHTVSGEAAPRAPFQSATAGAGTPIEQRIVAFAALALLFGALPYGLVELWRRQRRNPIALLLGVAAIAFFGVLGLRLAPSAWEIGNRVDEFLFVGLAFVVAAAVVHRVLERRRRWYATAAVAAGAMVVTVGGAITGWPTDALLATPVRIATEGRAIDSETISLGRWVGAHLSGSSFAAPEADARTIALYGATRAVTGPSIYLILSTPTLADWQLPTLRSRGVQYVVVDKRVRGNDNTTGYAFSVRPPGGPIDRLLPADVAPKFDELLAPRVFDSGNVAIYDLRGTL
jgi:hypothetical protein